jgi:hypothetical protein
MLIADRLHRSWTAWLILPHDQKTNHLHIRLKKNTSDCLNYSPVAPVNHVAPVDVIELKDTSTDWIRVDLAMP